VFQRGHSLPRGTTKNFAVDMCIVSVKSGSPPLLLLGKCITSQWHSPRRAAGAAGTTDGIIKTAQRLITDQSQVQRYDNQVNATIRQTASKQVLLKYCKDKLQRYNTRTAKYCSRQASAATTF
jgi:hypothetical protein